MNEPTIEKSNLHSESKINVLKVIGICHEFWKNNKLLIIVSIITGTFLAFAMYAPILFSREAKEGGLYFDSNTGAIGDTIGGITAPIINGLGSILLFITIMVQINTNKNQDKSTRLSREYESLKHDIDNVRRDVETFPDPDNLSISGIQGLNKLASHFPDVSARPNYSHYINKISFNYLNSLLHQIVHLFKRISQSKIDSPQKYDLRVKLVWLYIGKLNKFVSILSKTLDNDVDVLQSPASGIVECYKEIWNNCKLVVDDTNPSNL